MKTRRFITIINSIQVLALLTFLVGSMSVQALEPKWAQMPGGNAEDISVGLNGHIWMTSVGQTANGSLGAWRWDGSAWEDMGGPGIRIDAAKDGFAWVVAKDNSVWAWNGTPGSWFKQPGGLLDLAIGGDNSVWGIALDNTVRRFDGKYWQSMGGPNLATRVDVREDGVVWVVADGKVWQYNHNPGM